MVLSQILLKSMYSHKCPEIGSQGGYTKLLVHWPGQEMETDFERLMLPCYNELLYNRQARNCTSLTKEEWATPAFSET